MAGTYIGGVKASKTNRKKYGKDFYRVIGQRGGARGKTGGFACLKVGADGLTGQQRAEIAGAKGWKISRRRKAS